MDLPVPPPLLPMLAKRVADVPAKDGFLFEPKWDGFRTLVFRDGDEVLLQSRDEKPLNRYFPELLPQLLAQLPARCVLDGEIVVAHQGRLEFELLQQRIHPAASRVKLLAQQIPASLVFFDLLCEGDRDLRGVPFAERRAELERVLAAAEPPLHLTPSTRDHALASDWFRRFEGAGLDGVMAKPAGGAYEPNKRSMLKVKHERECDCVGTAIGSLLLGLHADDGDLQHVGVVASFTTDKRRQLVDVLAPYRENALDGHPWAGWAENDHVGDPDARRMPGAVSRWTGGKDLSWEPLRPELVVEVAYDHMQGRRFRHTAQFRRWRTDKAPRDCTYAQLEVVAPEELATIFASGR
jgi:ATP-dependent DNA ligase